MSDGIHGPLFDWLPPPAPSAPKPADQPAELARALSELEQHVMDFLRARLKGPPEGHSFHLGALTEYVQQRKQCAPDSPRRVMRELEAQGCCRVQLLDRRQSLYLVVMTAEDPP